MQSGAGSSPRLAASRCAKFTRTLLKLPLLSTALMEKLPVSIPTQPTTKMNIIKTILLSTIALLPFSSPALSQVVLQDNFASSSASNWAGRFIDGASVQFNDALELTPNAGNPEPAAAYRSFSSVALADGQILRMTFNVAVSDAAGQPYNVRFGLGFADPLITGTTGDLGVPLRGYYAILPIANNTTQGAILNFVNGSEISPVNFFNAETANLEIGPTFASGAAVTTSPKSVVWEIARVGSNLAFSGSLDGTVFSSGTATGANVLPDFEFNTVGFAYALDGNTGSYTNFTLEVIPEPSTLAYLGGLMVAVFAIKRRQVKSRA
jgi:hypothetical protein